MPSINPVIQVRVDPEIKAAASEVAAGIGIPLSTLINAFVTRLAWEGKVPFELIAPDVPNRRVRDAIDELEAGKGTRCASIEDMYKAAGIER
ncbi:MAG: type II toxin-antitoxin system RelB/DinJ family antitoxin [Synergistaceae bacterium]|nr:type II toxin-antitoxin system RelB/DinJ family antitoxin [Synergistaceae bacterium]